MLWTATVVARADLFVLRIDEESLQSLAAAYPVIDFTIIPNSAGTA
jgi:hypothetical protein